MKYEDQIIFHKKDKLDKFIEKLTGTMDKDTRAITLNEYDKLRKEINEKKTL